MPAISDVHISVPLSNISIDFATSTDGFVSTSVFPALGVKHKVDEFRTYDRKDRLRDDVKQRAPGTESVGGGWKHGVDTYSCKVYAYHVDLDDQTVDNSDKDAFSLQAEAAEFLGMKGAINREVNWVDTYFTTGVWSTDFKGGVAAQGVVGNTQGTKNADVATPSWNRETTDATGSHPFRQVEDQSLRMQILTGFRPNTIVMTRDLYNVTKNHGDFLDRMTGVSDYNQSTMSQAQMAGLFEVDRLLIIDGVYNTDAEVLEVADNNTINMSGNELIGGGGQMLLCYVSKKINTHMATAGMVFEWTGYRNQVANGIKTKKFRMESIESDRIEISMAYGMEQVAADLGVYYYDMLATS